ncbi:MAG: HlyD family efflux transporter periplasmic adaptor subunit [Candidatus Eisenbacteria bacterium]|uniref:HlyD family efflux transporter periplasmic adaptor subunit n=1 Tax=Eiseniibacteriota bacterium TaxID=2212470 RepID=A0A538U2L0_UNCEI|nr:MAG: HlyD family efflux transporter periplasmic adaptor subunit [Candidatus Eisenbacteria bacterium]
MSPRWTVGSMALALLVAGCAKHDDSNGGDKEAEVDVRTAVTSEREFRDEVVAPGQWRASGEVDVIAPGAAIVQSVEVRVGDEVKPGATVAWLESRESAAALQGARLMLEQAHDEASRAEARRALALARRDLVRLPVLAKRGGIVVRRSVEPGGPIVDGGEIAAIVPRDLIVFEARVAATDRARLRSGQAAVVATTGFPAIAASIQRILPVADSLSQATLVWLSARRGSPLPGLTGFGIATIAVGGPRSSAAVPDTAVVEDDLTGETRIAVVDAARRAIWTRVTLGARAGGWREVRSPPLPPGTRVIIEGQRGLPDSTRVKPIA